jgi:hypothetical protein
MAITIHNLSPMDKHHLIDTVTKLIAPIFDMNRPITVRYILAIYISDT